MVANRAFSGGYMHVVQDSQSKYVCVFRANEYIKGDST